jgi:2-enoate reductase
VLEGKTEDIRPCIGCHDGCFPDVGSLSCSVNPSCGRERLFAIQHVWKPKKVLIAGGGVAGMEAARVAAVRGHEVALYEKSDTLGGHLLEASVPDFKEDVKKLLNWYLRQIRKLEIEVHLNTEVKPKLVTEEQPDVVVVATGSTPTSAEIPGTEKLRVVNCCDLLLGKEKAGDNVVVYGGGLEGCETALWLARQGKTVKVVARHQAMPRGVFDANKKMLLEMLAEKEVQIVTNTIIQEANDGGVTVMDRNFVRKKVDCDMIVMAVGLKPERELYEALVSEVAEIYEIGDCKEPRRIHNAILEGYLVGHGI